MIADCFFLSLKDGLLSVECEYIVVKDYCKKYGLDTIDVFLTCKTMAGAFSEAS